MMGEPLVTSIPRRESQEVLGNCPNAHVVVVRLAYSPQEVNGVGKAHVPVESFEDVFFGS